MGHTLLERIQKLLAKTEENGCTEHEAAAAFAMASRIMAEAGLAMADVLAHDPEAAHHRAQVAHESARRDFLHDAATGVIAKYFSVRATIIRGERRVRYVLFGLGPDVEAAGFVWCRIVSACEAGWTRFRARFDSHPSARKSYVLGFMMGVEVKIRDQRAALEAERPGSGRELARLRDRLEEAFRRAMQQAGLTEGTAQSLAPVEWDAVAAMIGFAEGRRAAINREIEAPAR